MTVSSPYESKISLEGEEYELTVSKHAIDQWNRNGIPQEAMHDSAASAKEAIVKSLRRWELFYPYIPPETDFVLPADGNGYRFIVAKIDSRNREVVAVTVLTSVQNRYRQGLEFKPEDLKGAEASPEQARSIVGLRLNLARWERSVRKRNSRRL